jgi:hypothetical protein
MYKITDIASLGTAYSVAELSGEVISTIQVIPYTEILSATLGPYTDIFGSYTSYLEQSIAVLTGFEDIDPTRVLWWATSETEIELSEIIEYAVKYEYDIIIMEHLEELDD